MSRAAAWLFPVIAASAVAQERGEWRSLFNGEDLRGWEISLVYPMQGQFQHDRNPEPVFTVVEEDGEPAIHISGRLWGPLVSEEEFEDFHLRMEFKWGAGLWPPLEFRDTGVMYHSIGAPRRVTPDGSIREGGGIWMTSVEYQITEAGNLESEGHTMDVGAAYVLGTSEVRMDVADRRPARQREVGEWNLVEIRCVGDEARHYLNGELVARVENIRRIDGDRREPLTRGRLQIQSESAEVLFRRIEVRPIDSFDE